MDDSCGDCGGPCVVESALVEVHEAYPQPEPRNELIPGQNMGKWLAPLKDLPPGTVVTYARQHYWHDPEGQITGEFRYIRGRGTRVTAVWWRLA